MARERTPSSTARVKRPPGQIALTSGLLVVLDGPDAGRNATIESGELTIGTEVGAGLRLSDPTVSRRHALVEARSGQFKLRDLSSRNGTMLNGNRIIEAFLKPGDLVVLGDTTLRFEPRQEDVNVPPSTRTSFGALRGSSVSMRQVFGILERIAPTDATVLITGETGTGKDLVAQALHAASPRANGPLLVFDASAAAPELLASELFGHEAGSFTGANRRTAGVFEAAHGGTVFLDEIGELPLELQPKLLRVLESRMVRPLGANRSVAVDVRIIAATHRDLGRMVEKGTFRQDLYYRLAVVSVELPPLRVRVGDLEELVKALLERLVARPPRKKVSDEALAVLAAQSWPGNVRELRNVLERTLALSAGPIIDVSDLMMLPASRHSGGAEGGLAGRTLEDMERELIRQTLERTGDNQREAARLLGIHRNTLRHKMVRFGMVAKG